MLPLASGWTLSSQLAPAASTHPATHAVLHCYTELAPDSLSWAEQHVANRSCWYGESEERLHNLFKACDKFAMGAIIFVDELDGLVGSR